MLFVFVDYWEQVGFLYVGYFIICVIGIVFIFVMW